MTAPVRVGIAVVEADDRFLVGIRAADTVLPGMAEFPGGKCESDEAPRACVVRECREETDLIVLPVLHLATVTHQYDHGLVELHFWRCCLAQGTHQTCPPRSPFRWVERSELADLLFPEANCSVLEMLAAEASDMDSDMESASA
ncbi:MAG: (deoxy)nucleoside triphosphate pyrophosphohydrolase [Planctomycetaceae bacterium]|nr:(deoxy)nucleoside triphosphate pyrophosphohydrolase [Planctomycetaceae bacterium]